MVHITNTTLDTQNLKLTNTLDTHNCNGIVNKHPGYT